MDDLYRVVAAQPPDTPVLVSRVWGRTDIHAKQSHPTKKNPSTVPNSETLNTLPDVGAAQLSNTFYLFR